MELQLEVGRILRKCPALLPASNVVNADQSATSHVGSFKSLGTQGKTGRPCLSGLAAARVTAESPLVS